MNRLVGFRYRDVVQRLKAHGFEFERQQSKSLHRIPNHPGNKPEGRSVRDPRDFSRVDICHSRGPSADKVKLGGLLPDME